MTCAATIPTVFLVDDDPAVLHTLSRLLRLAGYQVSAFASSQEFLVGHDRAVPGCLVLELIMPGLNGLELHNALTASGPQRPTIFISGHADVSSSVQAMKTGAVDFLTKPVSKDYLLGAIRRAVEKDRQMREAGDELRAIGTRLATLTRRELEVFHQVVAGRLNKQIAWDLGIGVKTIKVHRGRVMEKMGVHSLADLVRMADRIRAGQASAQAARPTDHPYLATENSLE